LPLPSLPLASASARWQAVVKRDPTATTFVYAVLTTKIYCRASCPARLARRANVRFYDLPAQAEWAGFRACKRCNPDSLWSSSNRNDNPQVQLVQRTCQTIASLIQSGSRPTLQVLAAEMGLTTSHSHRVFKKVMGVTPGQYVA
ncbi:putative DNA repair and transcription factor Ada, partial [Aspergillus homomorphus CBS 101889]